MMEKQRYSIWVLFILLSASFFTGFHSYKTTEKGVAEDMKQALAMTMAEQQTDVISQDTVRAFNGHLQLAELRGKATIAVDTRQKEFTCYAKCSAATILSLSDQRPAMALWAVSVLWAFFCLYRYRRSMAPRIALLREGCQVYGGIIYSDTDRLFYTSEGQSIRLTPMQQQLMEMFFQSPSRRLSKQEICETLWPKKPDANDTLYTLIRRLRPIIETHSNLKIESDRGKTYQLTVNDLS